MGKQKFLSLAVLVLLMAASHPTGATDEHSGTLDYKRPDSPDPDSGSNDLSTERPVKATTEPMEPMVVPYELVEDQKLPAPSGGPHAAALPGGSNWYIGGCSGNTGAGPAFCGTKLITVESGAYAAADGSIRPSYEIQYTQMDGDVRFALGAGDFNLGARVASGQGTMWTTVAFLDSAVGGAIQCKGWIAIYMSVSWGNLNIREVIFNKGEMDAERDEFFLQMFVKNQDKLARWHYLYLDACSDAIHVHTNEDFDLGPAYAGARAHINVESGPAAGTSVIATLHNMPRWLWVQKDRPLSIGGDSYTDGIHIGLGSRVDGYISAEISAGGITIRDLEAYLGGARNIWLNWRDSFPYAVLGYGLETTNDFVDVYGDFLATEYWAPSASIWATRLSNGQIYFDNRPGPDQQLAPGWCGRGLFGLLWECNFNNYNA